LCSSYLWLLLPDYNLKIEMSGLLNRFIPDLDLYFGPILRPVVNLNVLVVEGHEPVVDQNLVVVDGREPVVDQNLLVVDGREPVVDLNLLVVSRRLPVVDPNLLVMD
jgi:hypothetical protein